MRSTCPRLPGGQTLVLQGTTLAALQGSHDSMQQLQRLRSIRSKQNRHCDGSTPSVGLPLQEQQLGQQPQQ